MAPITLPAHVIGYSGAFDRRKRFRRLALETIDHAKDPYFMRSHLGSYECKLCLTLHNNEGNYLAHTQGKRIRPIWLRELPGRPRMPLLSLSPRSEKSPSARLPLHHAAREHAGVIRLLLSAGSSPPTRTYLYGKIPSELADPDSEARRVLEAAVGAMSSQ